MAGDNATIGKHHVLVMAKYWGSELNVAQWQSMEVLLPSEYATLDAHFQAAQLDQPAQATNGREAKISFFA